MSDPSMAGALYAFREEFHVWASMSNLGYYASHQYWLDANTQQWYIRSATCVTVIDFTFNVFHFFDIYWSLEFPGSSGSGSCFLRLGLGSSNVIDDDCS